MNLTKTVKERKKALDDMTPLMEDCHNCKLRGKQQFDRVMECCITCPTQKKIEFVRFRLEKTMAEIRAIRS